MFCTEKEQRESPNDKPTPDDFEAYLPWACQQLRVDANVVITRVIQNEYVSAVVSERMKTKGKSKTRVEQSKTEVTSDQENDKGRCILGATASSFANTVKIYTIYDLCENLVQIKFDKNIEIPRQILKIIGLIIRFHIYLTNVTINRGLNSTSFYEFCKIIPLSNITDVCLDNTVIPQANYEMLLGNQMTIRRLSLSRCKISDDIVKSLAAKLHYPLPASSYLYILNLASNTITDSGAKYIAEALRSNRRLSYLNLADNMITDEGATAIINNLMEFPLNNEELLTSRSRLMKFLKEKNELISRMMVELRLGDFDRKTARRKTIRPSSVPPKKARGLEKEGSLKCVSEPNKSIINMEAIFYEKAESMAENVMGEFKDPFSSQNISTTGGVVYCFGNNSLSYLNLAYNSVSFLTIPKLLEALKSQKDLDRKPRGLINVIIEGNNLPIHCKELTQIDNILKMGLMVYTRKLSTVRKRSVAKAFK